MPVAARLPKAAQQCITATGVDNMGSVTYVTDKDLGQIKCGDLIRSAHCIGQSNFHLQFTPAYRRDAFVSEKVRNTCREYIYKKANELKIVVFAMEFGPDHVHLFVGNCRLQPLPELVQQLKGGSSYAIRKECWDEIKSKLWGKKFWTGGYFYEGVGSVTSPAIKFYIERQQGKHWTEKELLELENSKIIDGKQTRLTAFFS